MKSAHSESSTGLTPKTGAILIGLFIVLVGVLAGLFLVNRSQSPAEFAAEPPPILQESGPSCPTDGFICKWDREPGVSYHYTMKDTDGNIVKEGDIPPSGVTEKITVTYTPEVGNTYTCEVVATNDCGEASDSASTMCSAVPQSPTPSLSPTLPPEEPTPTTPANTPTEGPSPTVTLVPSPTPTTPSGEPTNTPAPTNTPEPTDIIIVNTTEIPPTNTPSSPEPTLPQAGPGFGLFNPTTLLLSAGLFILMLGLLL